MLRQNDKDGLHHVLGVVGVAQRAAADAQDHGAMAAHEDFKGCLVLGTQEGTEQGPVGLLAILLAGGQTKPRRFSKRAKQDPLLVGCLAKLGTLHWPGKALRYIRLS